MDDGTTAIADLEAVLEGSLVDRRTVAKFSPDWLPAGNRWSAAVWQCAETLGSPTHAVSPDDAMAFAQRAVFVCGAHRSGTTLVRDLLDGHPDLCVLPAEAAYFGGMELAVAGKSWDDRVAHIGQAWLRRLVNPTNQPPFWLLGRTSASATPYVDFARAYVADAAMLRDASARDPALLGIACAYARARGQDLRRLAWWVEKTPGTERRLKRIWRDLPHAKVIHVVRSPDAAARSYRALSARANRDAASTTATLRALAASYAIALRTVRSTDPDRYMIVQYEALVADLPATMRRVARFLRIDDDPALHRQSIAGLPASPNASPSVARLGWLMVEGVWLVVARVQYRRLLRALV